MADDLLLCRLGGGFDHRITAKMADLASEVELKAAYAVLEPYDLTYPFKVPDEKVALAAFIMRSLGHGWTEIWPVVRLGESLPLAQQERQIDEALKSTFLPAIPPLLGDDDAKVPRCQKR